MTDPVNPSLQSAADAAGQCQGASQSSWCSQTLPHLSACNNNGYRRSVHTVKQHIHCSQHWPLSIIDAYQWSVEEHRHRHSFCSFHVPCRD